MRIVHIGDTHLGYSGIGLQSLVEDPHRPGVRIRQQEFDIQRGLEKAVDHILAEVLPAVVVHSGDLFESPLPSASALDFAMQQFHRLSREGIPVLVVEGDHSCPRSRSHGHILAMLSYLPDVTVICGEPESHTVGGIRFHAVPHRAALEGMSVEEGQLDPSRPNVLVTHGIADGRDIYRTGRRAAHLDIRTQAGRFDYLALGHWHRFGQIPNTCNAFYAGATAMVSSADFYPGYKFGFNVVDLEGETPRIERCVVETRAMHAYGLDHAEGLTAEQILEFLARQASALTPKEAYCRIVIEGIDPRARQMLANRQIEELFSEAAGLTISMRAREARWDAVETDLLTGGSPEVRFDQLVDQMDGEAPFKEAVREQGLRFLREAATRVESEHIKGGDAEETP